MLLAAALIPEAIGRSVGRLIACPGAEPQLDDMCLPAVSRLEPDQTHGEVS
jgi:hypothetical protein